ncbi:hypothetical protein HDV05_007835, partial [Chytridiales sp. JEL 0842]
MPEPNKALELRPASPPTLNSTHVMSHPTIDTSASAVAAAPAAHSPTGEQFYSPTSSPVLSQKTTSVAEVNNATIKKSSPPSAMLRDLLQPLQQPSASNNLIAYPSFASAAEADNLFSSSTLVAPTSTLKHQAQRNLIPPVPPSTSICDESFMLLPGDDPSILFLNDEELPDSMDSSPDTPPSGAILNELEEKKKEEEKSIKESVSTETFKDALSHFPSQDTLVDVTAAQVITTSVPPPPTSTASSQSPALVRVATETAHLFTPTQQQVSTKPTSNLVEFDPLATVNRPNKNAGALLTFETPGPLHAFNATATKNEGAKEEVKTFGGASLLDVQNLFATPKSALKYSERDMGALRAEMTAKFEKEFELAQMEIQELEAQRAKAVEERRRIEGTLKEWEVFMKGMI